MIGRNYSDGEDYLRPRDWLLLTEVVPGATPFRPIYAKLGVYFLSETRYASAACPIRTKRLRTQIGNLSKSASGSLRIMSGLKTCCRNIDISKEECDD